MELTIFIMFKFLILIIAFSFPLSVCLFQSQTTQVVYRPEPVIERKPLPFDVVVVVMAVVWRPCLSTLLESLNKFYLPQQIYIYHDDERIYENYRYTNYTQIKRFPLDSDHQSPYLSNKWSDSPERVQWRSRLVYDYAMMLSHMAGRCKTLITSEDDVEHHFDLSGISIPLTAYRPGVGICSTPPNKKTLGPESSGRSHTYVFPNRELKSLSLYLLALWDYKPVEWLVHDYFQMKSEIQLSPALSQPRTCTLVSHLKCSSTKKILYNISG
jgi:hypothetical protein